MLRTIFAFIFCFTIIIIIRRRPFCHIPVLLYHSVSNNVLDERLTMDIKTFKKQMSMIRILGYKPITIEEYIQCRSKNEYIKSSEILITFDDGYEDNFLYAYPILLRNRFPAAIFLTTAFVGKKARWLEEYPVLKKKKMLTWEQIIEMHENNISFCSHTVTHRNLNVLDRTSLIYELGDSKRLLEKKLKMRIIATSFPFSSHNKLVIRVAQECGYEIGFAVDTGDETELRINRIECFDKDNMFIFFLKISGWYAPLIKIKQTISLKNARSKK